jgi:small subunit ribosomal protein S1
MGTVVNVMSYGAFVKLEDGVEGLVHISEMSWTKRVSHPSELVKPGDEVEVVVLAINKEKQEISLGMKQTQQNPWEKVAADYPPGAIVKGVVRNLTNYGAFIEIDDGIDGLLHVTDMSWTRKVTHPSEMVDKGQEIECKVLSVDQQRRRIALGLKQMADDPWTGDIPSRYKAGDVVNGTITTSPVADSDWLAVPCMRLPGTTISSLPRTNVTDVASATGSRAVHGITWNHSPLAPGSRPIALKWSRT